MKLKMFKFGNFEENVALQHLFFIKETKMIFQFFTIRQI